MQGEIFFLVIPGPPAWFAGGIRNPFSAYACFEMDAATMDSGFHRR